MKGITHGAMAAIVGLALLARASNCAAVEEPEKGVKKPRSVQELIEKVRDKKARVERWSAVSELATLGAEAKAAVPALIDALADEDQFLREGAAQALGKIGAEAKAAIPALKNALRDPQLFVGPEAGLALWRIAEVPEAMDALLLFLMDQDHFIRGKTATCLAEIGRKAQKAVAPLKQGLMDKEELVRIRAAHALWRIARYAAAIPVILDGLKSADSQTRISAAALLGGLDIPSASVVPALLNALKDSD